MRRLQGGFCLLPLAVTLANVAVSAHVADPLTVCADPNNLPFSDRAHAGFENKIAALVAKDLNVTLAYTWWVQRRGFVRNTLNDAKCDVWLGVASGLDRVATMQPYYRSTYVFVTRSEQPLAGLTLDDPRLRSVLIGVQLIGNDAMNTPPAHALSARGLTQNVRGFMVYRNYAEPNDSSAIIDAVVHKQIDVAVVWGPLAGYFAKRANISLRLEAVTPAQDPDSPMTYDISMGVRPDDLDLKQLISSALTKEASAIRSILTEYGVPQLPLPPLGKSR
jgi:mxaJ protein